MGIGEAIKDELKSRNFSIYGQWTGILCVILCIALGIANLFTTRILIIGLSAVCLASGFLIIFIEVPFLLRICPTSTSFDNFVRRFETNYTRAAIYLILSVIQWLSLIQATTSLIAAAVFLLFASIFYALAGVRGQAFINSKTLGGQGVAQMIV